MFSSITFSTHYSTIKKTYIRKKGGLYYTASVYYKPKNLPSYLIVVNTGISQYSVLSYLLISVYMLSLCNFIYYLYFNIYLLMNPNIQFNLPNFFPCFQGSISNELSPQWMIHTISHTTCPKLNSLSFPSIIPILVKGNNNSVSMLTRNS